MTTLLLLLALAAEPAPDVNADAGVTVGADADDETESDAEAGKIRAEADAAALARLTPDQLAQVLVAREKSKNGGAVAWIASLAFFATLLGGVLAVLMT
jgi:hypothetical protein